MKEPGTEELVQKKSCLYNFYKDDLVLADREMNQFSLNPALQRNDSNNSSFELFSDRMQRLYPTYTLDPESGMFMATP